MWHSFKSAVSLTEKVIKYRSKTLTMNNFIPNTQSPFLSTGANTPVGDIVDVKIFQPVHLADLQESGLTNETIQAAGIYTVPTDEIAKKLGSLAEGVVSALAFPYPGCGVFERFKVWRAEGDAGPKYLQKAGTPNHLYFPPEVELRGDSPLLIVEGEKKALALWQAGFQVLGIGGVWNWCGHREAERQPGKPIPDLDKVNWRRPIIIVFDSDGHDNHNIRLAAYRLARELTQRGGQISILFLPSGQGGTKVGADDYLKIYGSEGLGTLLKAGWPFDPVWNDREAEIYWHLKDLTPDTPKPETLKRLAPLAPKLAKLGNLEAEALLEGVRERLRLRVVDLEALRKDIKVARKAQESKKEKKGKGTVLELKDLEESFRLHPAIDFLGDAMCVGFRVHTPENDTGLLLLISDGQRVRTEVNPEMVEIAGHTHQVIQTTTLLLLEDKWNLKRIQAFVDHPTRPQNLFTDLQGALRTYLDLPEPAFGLLAAWTVGTYFAHLFTAFPYLHFHGPKESGKSKSLEALRWVCFNAWKGRDITSAALGDTTEDQRGTLLLDQAEKLNRDKETGNLIGLLADSYKKAGGRRRVIQLNNAGRTPLEFSTYGPKAFASTKNLDPDLADRCIKVPMTRTRRRLPDLEGWEPVWSELRDQLYRFTLASFKEVQTYYRRIEGGGTRIGELWRPLSAVLLALRVDQAEVEAIRALFMEGAEETRHEPSPWESRLLEVLQGKAEKNSQAFELTAAEVLDLMRIEGDKQPTPKWVGDALSQFHLYQGKRRATIQGRKKTSYQFDPVRVIDLCSRYLREEGPDEKEEKKCEESPENDLPHLSARDNTNDSNNLCRTRQIQGTRSHLSTLGAKRHGGHEESCPSEMTCPSYHTDNLKEKAYGHEGHENLGGIPKEKSAETLTCFQCKHFIPSDSSPNPAHAWGHCQKHNKARYGVAKACESGLFTQKTAVPMAGSE
jgi:hypothetical protein